MITVVDGVIAGGAFTSAAIGLALAGPSAGGSRVFSSVLGCVIDVGIGAGSEALGKNSAQAAGYEAGFNALALGVEVAEAVGRVR